MILLVEICTGEFYIHQSNRSPQRVSKTQLQIVRHIYLSANEVTVWLGPESEETDRAMDSILWFSEIEQGEHVDVLVTMDGAVQQPDSMDDNQGVFEHLLEVV